MSSNILFALEQSFDNFIHIDYYLYVQLNTETKTKKACVNCFKNLGVETKHAIYVFLKNNGKASVGHLVKEVGLSQPTVSHHLHNMQKDGLLKSEKKGKVVYYSINSVCPVYESECVLHSLKMKG